MALADVGMDDPSTGEISGAPATAKKIQIAKKGRGFPALAVREEREAFSADDRRGNCWRSSLEESTGCGRIGGRRLRKELRSCGAGGEEGGNGR
jgi:hypothetical protein